VNASSAKAFKDFNNGIELWMKRVRSASEEHFREMVWDLFKTVVRETPQWSGKAVANWNIGIGSVGDEYNDDYGDEGETVMTSASHNDWYTTVAPHEKGDRKWATVALNRNRPIMKSIKLNDKIFIYNHTIGDENFSYLEGFQSSPDWPTKLRVVNRPYETVQQSVAIVTKRWATKGMNMNTTRGDRLGGFTLDGE